jgi:hypothetical protein
VQILCSLCIYNPLIFLMVPRFNSYSKHESFDNVKTLCIHSHHEIQMGYQPVSQFVLMIDKLEKHLSSSTLPKTIAMDNSTNFNHFNNLEQII